MDAQLRNLASQLREMGSEKAADWLLENFPATLPPGHADCGKAIKLIPHLSWKRADQQRLASHYLGKLPHASSTAYEAFAGIMRVTSLIETISENLPASRADRDLLLYYLAPTLRKAARNERDSEVVADFLKQFAS